MKLRAFLGKKHRKLKNEKILKGYLKRFQATNAESEQAILSGRSAERSILIQSHVIEKGLSHKNLKPLFGRRRITTISNSLKDYVDKNGKDEYVIGIATSSLETYNEVNRKFKEVSEKDLIPLPEGKLSANKLPVGAKEVTREEFFKGSDGNFSELCRSRHSLRLYDCESKEISYEDLLHCIEIAQNCPNSCNRQAVRVKVVLDRDKIAEITKIQGGSDGFGEKSGALLAVTSDLSLYTLGEQNLPMIDCGIFIMNLIYALYEKKLGSCVLNCCLTEKEENKLKELISLPDGEAFAAIISVSNVPEKETVMICNSVKRPVSDIVQRV